jgi:hypothetical protein
LRLRENLQDIFKLLSGDEVLLRLLFYKPVSPVDDPLSEQKANILSKSLTEKWAIINDIIKTVPKDDDLETAEKCRLFIFPGSRRSMGSYVLANQVFVFDVLTHFAFEDMDQRMEWVCDRINDLISQERITGVGKANFVSGNPIGAPKGYVGYRLTYDFGSVSV